MYFILSAIVLNGLIPAIIFHTSRKFFQTGAREMTKTTETTKTSKNVFDVTLLRDPIIMIFLFNSFILDITGKQAILGKRPGISIARQLL